MNTPHDFLKKFLPAHLGNIKHARQVSDGDICQSFFVETTERPIFIKIHQQPPPQMFAKEAKGLRELEKTGAIDIPEVYHQSDNLLALEYLPPESPSAHYWRVLGHNLAKLHQNHSPEFGFEEDNYCGLTIQKNSWNIDGYHFFAQNRLLFQGEMAFNEALLNAEELRLLERLCTRLEQLIPSQPASLIHGDLWSGNHLCSNRKPWLIDPATHYGWAEAEIAMTRLFGGFDSIFYQAYLEINPLEKDWEARLPLYNLYHLLNHLNLFGSSYHSKVITTIRDYL